MRAPLLSFVVVLAVVATVSLVPAVCNGQEAATAGEGHGGSIKPLSASVDGYGPPEKAAKNLKEKILDAQGTPKVTASSQIPTEEEAEKATASTADDQLEKYVMSLAPDEKAEKEKIVESEKEKKAKKEKKVKKEKKEKSDSLDESTASMKEKKEKSDGSESVEPAYGSAYTKKEKKVKKEKKEKSASAKKHKKKKSDEDSDATSSKKHKKEKSIDSDASSAYLNKKEKKSGVADEATTSLKKQKKHKKKKAEEENPDEDAVPADVSTDGQYVSTDAKLNKGGERQISTNADAYPSPKQQVVVSSSSAQPIAAGSPDEPLPTAKSSATSQPMAAGSPDEFPPAAKSSTTSYPMAAGSPDELPPAAKRPATFDQFASSKFQVLNSQPTAAGGALPPPQANSPPGNPKLSMQTLSGVLKQPIAKLLSPVIKSVCAKVEYPEDCESSISNLPGAASAAATDNVGVLRLVMEAVREKVVVAMNAATDRMNAPGLDPATKDALSSCTSSYSDIKSSLDTVDEALKRGDLDTAKTNLDTVETDLTTCDDGFQERNTPQVMGDHDQELQKLAGNLLSIGNIIKPQ